jgi:tetratricopeptide (TPR) repeat protein
LAQGQSPGHVEESVNRVLASRTFERSERARALLAYLVREERAGNGDRLKGFTIAADVFGKDASFDSATDPLVRVQMGRLRELLELYYLGEGKDDPLRIVLRKGSYCPTYEPPGAAPTGIGARLARELAGGRAAAGGATVPDAAADPDLFGSGAGGEGLVATGPLPATVFLRHIRLYWVAFAVIIGMLAFLVYVNRDAIDFRGSRSVAADENTPSRGRRGAVTAEMLPALRILTDLKDPSAIAMAEDIALLASRFDYVRTIKPADKNEAATGSQSAGRLDYGLIVVPGTGGEALMELVSLADGRLVLSRKAPAQGREAAFAAFLDSAATPEGVLHSDVAQSANGNALTECIERARAYYLNGDESTHGQAYDCMSQLLERGARLGLVHSEHAALFAEGVDNGFARPPRAGNRRDMLETALKAARRGFDLSPRSARAAREVANVYKRQGDALQAAEWFARAYELNPSDTVVAASHAAGLLAAGRYGDAAAVFEAAEKIQPRHPVWWDYNRALCLMMTGNIRNAREEATDLSRAPGNVEYSVLRMALAKLAGDQAETEAMRALVEARRPGYFSDVAGNLKKSGLPDSVAGRVAAAISG